jgi:hypothetical protein
MERKQNEDAAEVIDEIEKLYTERSCYADVDDQKIDIPLAKRTLKSRIGAAADAPHGQTLPTIEEVHSLIDAWTADKGDAFAMLSAIDRKLNENQSRRVIGADDHPRGTMPAFAAQLAGVDMNELEAYLAEARRTGNEGGTLQMQRRTAAGIAGRDSRDERGRSAERQRHTGVCYQFQRNECKLGNTCRYEHTRDRSRSRDRGRGNGGGEWRGHSRDSGSRERSRSRSRSRETQQARHHDDRGREATAGNPTSSSRSNVAEAAGSSRRPGTPRGAGIDRA